MLGVVVAPSAALLVALRLVVGRTGCASVGGSLGTHLLHNKYNTQDTHSRAASWEGWVETAPTRLHSQDVSPASTALLHRHGPSVCNPPGGPMAHGGGGGITAGICGAAQHTCVIGKLGTDVWLTAHGTAAHYSAFQLTHPPSALVQSNMESVPV